MCRQQEQARGDAIPPWRALPAWVHQHWLWVRRFATEGQSIYEREEWTRVKTSETMLCGLVPELQGSSREIAREKCKAAAEIVSEKWMLPYLNWAMLHISAITLITLNFMYVCPCVWRPKAPSMWRTLALVLALSKVFLAPTCNYHSCWVSMHIWWCVILNNWVI